MTRYRMDICTSMDDNYAKYAYVMLKSLFDNNQDAEVYVHILQTCLSQKSIENLNDVCIIYGNHLDIITVDESRIDKRIITTENWGMEASYRLQMIELLPENIDRVLYLDVDMIINKSIEELYHTEFGEMELVAAVDMPLLNGKGDLFKQLRSGELQPLFDDRKYFNSGMILFNLNGMRGTYSLDKYIKLAKDLNFNIYAPDQDLLNMMHQQKVIFVDPWKYNFFAGIGIDAGYDYDRVMKEVSIIHFAGKKPWKGGDHIHFSIEKIWWDHALNSPYRDTFLVDYALDSIMDESVRQYVQSLLGEIDQLKTDLNTAIESFQKLYAAYQQ